MNSALLFRILSCSLCLFLLNCTRGQVLAQVALRISPAQLRLITGSQFWLFDQRPGGWSLGGIDVDGQLVAQPASPLDSFWLGGGEASSYEVLTNTAEEISLRFKLSKGSAVYRVRANEPLPVVHVAIDGPEEVTCIFRTAGSAPDEHGAWVTRGWVATDADASEAFIDASNPCVFGHSRAGDLDVGYCFLPRVNGHIQKNGRTEQRTGTFFKTERCPEGGDRFTSFWQLRMTKSEPKEFAVLFDRNGGGRMSDVCEKHFAGAVDMLVNLPEVPRSSFNPEECVEIMPVRLAAPDGFIPGWGVMMDEFPNASYPFAHDSVFQTAALLAFEGLATDRAWEHNFARYFLDKTPLEGPDGKSYFVRRPGGLTRWGYFGTYRDGFVPLDGGCWWQADILYRTALALNDRKLRQASVDMVLHDLNVKLDLQQMKYPPCWSARLNRVGDDHRDDWFRTPGLAWCAYIASRIAWPESGDSKYLNIADRICEWFAGYMVPEQKLNNLQGNNMHAVFSHYLTLAFLDKYDRSQDRRFLDLARDMAWVHIMTTCTTGARDPWGNPLTGTTCVGVRECVDYDCSPNLCQEKDLTFVHIIGPLLEHVSGPAYAKYIALNRLVLDKDSWKSAWVTELRDTNLRTMYDTYARGMANLIYALDRSSNPEALAVETLVSKSDTNIVSSRDLFLANPTGKAQSTTVELRYLRPGSYELTKGNAGPSKIRIPEENKIHVTVAPNSMTRVTARALKLEAPAAPQRKYDSGVTWLSDLEPFAAQRGTGLPEPTFRKDRSFNGGPITLKENAFKKGLGCAANTVLVYGLKGRYERFRAKVGVDQEVAGTSNPRASVFFTVHADGNLLFESGPMFAVTPSKSVDVDVRSCQVLMLRVSCNWDDNGDSRNDHGDWAEACFVGKTEP